MKVYDAATIRNVAVVGHGGCGKTQLVSAMLFDGGAVNRLGRVDDGTTVTDFDEEEIARKHTLSSSVAFLEWNKNKINVIDTPGFANFLSDARAALRVADAAIVVVDAVAGVEVQTEKVWGIAEEFNLPRLVVLGRVERERASQERTLESLRNAFGRAIVPVVLPLGDEKNFTGVIDLVAMKAYTYAADGSGKFTAADVPDSHAEAAKAARDSLVEMVAEADDSLMEKFFEAGTLSQEDLISGLKRGVHAGKVFPLLPTSGAANVGIQVLLDAILAYVPSPAERPFPALTKTGEPAEVDAAEGAPYAAFVWKTVADAFAGRITMFRVISGALKADTTVHNFTKDVQERLGHLLVQQGKQQTQVPEVKAGDLGAVAKLKDTLTNDVLADGKSSVVFQPIKFAEPLLSYAIEVQLQQNHRLLQSKHKFLHP